MCLNVLIILLCSTSTMSLRQHSKNYIATKSQHSIKSNGLWQACACNLNKTCFQVAEVLLKIWFLSLVQFTNQKTRGLRKRKQVFHLIQIESEENSESQSFCSFALKENVHLFR
jgi:hypothetical protein